MQNKKIILSIIAISALIGTTKISNANNITINDINNHWAKNEIQDFINKGYINGYPEDNTFRPENPITRAEFVKIVNKVFRYTKTSEIAFNDVAKGEWYYEEVQKAVQAGYILGYPEDNTFKPQQPIKREEAAKIIATIMNKIDDNLDKLNSYVDESLVSPWAKPYIEGVLEAKYMNGYSEDNTFRPNVNIKRSEAVITLSRTQNNDEENIKIMYTTAKDGLNIRNGPGTSYDSLGKLPLNTKVEVVEILNGWAKIKHNNSVAYVSTAYLSESMVDTNEPRPLPTIPQTPKEIETPQNSEVIDSSQDIYQNNLTLEKNIDNHKLTSIGVIDNTGGEIAYSIYTDGAWISELNGAYLSSTKPIEGIKIELKNPKNNRHVFYRTKIKGKGWQGWVKDNKISGEIGNGNIIEDIQIREIQAEDVNSMVKPTIAVDIGHNVERPVKAGSIGLYKEDTLTKVVGERIIYQLRQEGYNVVDTLPTGRYSQNDELSIRAKVANLNEVDKFVSIHFNTFDGSANGTEVFYINRGDSKNMATQVSKNLSDNFGFKNRGAKENPNLAVLKLTKMPSILVEGCFIDNISDMNKFIDKGEAAYDIMAEAIIRGALN